MNDILDTLAKDAKETVESGYYKTNPIENHEYRVVGFTSGELLRVEYGLKKDELENLLFTKETHS